MILENVKVSSQCLAYRYITHALNHYIYLLYTNIATLRVGIQTSIVGVNMYKRWFLNVYFLIGFITVIFEFLDHEPICII